MVLYYRVFRENEVFEFIKFYREFRNVFIGINYLFKRK